MRYAEPDVVIVGAGIAGGALGTVLARAGFEVVLIERETNYPDRVRGEFIVPWGVTELAKLELLQPLREAGALFTRRNIPYDEIFAPAEAETRALDLTKMHAEGARRSLPGPSRDVRYSGATRRDFGRQRPARRWRHIGNLGIAADRQLPAQRQQPRIPAAPCDRRRWTQLTDAQKFWL